MRWARRLLIGAAALALLSLAPLAGFDLASGKSVCFGQTHKGRIEGAVRMPARGPNFQPYCWPCIAALRTHGHDKVIQTVTAAYGDLAKSNPGTTFVYGEIGLPNGGRFPPHRTHQNGLSVDFMVPVREGPKDSPTSATLPTTALNRFGYDEDFDTEGQQKLSGEKGLRVIDFDAIAAHLTALDRQARARGGRIHRIFFAPDLQDELFAADPSLKRLRFNRRQSWVRHDDHYHVDFAFACR